MFSYRFCTLPFYLPEKSTPLTRHGKFTNGLLRETEVWLGLGRWDSHCSAQFSPRPSSRPPAGNRLFQATKPTSFLLEPFNSPPPCCSVSCPYTPHLSAKDSLDTPVTWILLRMQGAVCVL